MSDASFKVGDVVQLKSGGPIMTIAEINGDDAYCEWFSSGKQSEGSFKMTSLVPHRSGPRGPTILAG
jgi:uncharacterized protein YodC (DUF2158 family)